MAILDSKEVRHLQAAIRDSEDWFADVRNTRTAMYRKLAGNLYPGNGFGLSGIEPVNIFYTNTAMYLSFLVGSQPRGRIRTRFPAYRATAQAFSLHLDGLLRRLDAEGIMRELAMDALYSFSVAFVGLRRKGETLINGRAVTLTEPYFERIDPDDFVMDVNTRSMKDAWWIGHSFFMSTEEAKERFENTEKLTPHTDGTYAKKPQEDIKGKAKVVNRDYKEMSLLYQVFIPETQQIVYLPAINQGTEPLDVVDWTGPPQGPYVMGEVMPLPNNPRGVPPAAQWLDMHNLINTIVRKFQTLMREYKTVTAGSFGSEEDMEKLEKAPHGSKLILQDVDNIKQFQTVEPPQSLMMFAQWAMHLASFVGGNSDLLGGMSANARSATEADILRSNSSTRVNDMRIQLEKQASDIFEHLCFYEMSDTMIDATVYKEIDGTGLTIPMRINRKTMQGEHWDYIYDIKPYSMGPKDPRKAAQDIMLLFNQAILPMAGLAPNIGQQLDVPRMLQKVAEELGIDDFDEFFIADPGLNLNSGQGDQGGDIREQMSESTRTSIPAAGAPANSQSNDQLVSIT